MSKENQENELLSFLIRTVERIEVKVDEIKSYMVTKEDCKSNQEQCSQKFKEKKIEKIPANITAIGGILAAIFGFVLALIKLLS